jgi:hypothetical protein
MVRKKKAKQISHSNSSPPEAGHDLFLALAVVALLAEALERLIPGTDAHIVGMFPQEAERNAYVRRRRRDDSRAAFAVEYLKAHELYIIIR